MEAVPALETALETEDDWQAQASLKKTRKAAGTLLNLIDSKTDKGKAAS